MVAVGAPLNDGMNGGDNAGHVRVYRKVRSDWLKLGEDIDGNVNNDWFGFSVSLSSNGNTIAIGAPFNGPGYVQVFSWNGSGWVQQGSNIEGEADDNSYSYSGYSVSLSNIGDIVAIGARAKKSYNRGHTRVPALGLG